MQSVGLPAIAPRVTGLMRRMDRSSGLLIRRSGSNPRIEVKRWRDGEDMMWQYVGFTARLQHLGPPDADPTLFTETR